MGWFWFRDSCWLIFLILIGWRFVCLFVCLFLSDPFGYNFSIPLAWLGDSYTASFTFYFPAILHNCLPSFSCFKTFNYTLWLSTRREYPFWQRSQQNANFCSSLSSPPAVPTLSIKHNILSMRWIGFLSSLNRRANSTLYNLISSCISVHSYYSDTRWNPDA